MPDVVQLSSSPSSPSRHVQRLVKRASRAIMKSQKLTLPKYDLPIRLRPWFLLFTTVFMLLLAFFGFTDVSHSLPLNNKFVHLTCFCIATGMFYFIFDVDEDARRVWYWRHADLIFTVVVCFFFGGLISQVVHSLLPHNRFDVGDVVANLIGSAIGLYISYHIERHYRSRREIARLYRPLNTDDSLDQDYSDDEAGPSGTQLLPLFNAHPASSAKSSLPSKAKASKRDRLADVWDEREELFGIGDDSDLEDTPTGRTNRSSQPGPVPTIIVTQS